MEIIADNLSKAGWSWGCVSILDREGRTIWIADAHRDDGRRFVVHADEKRSPFLEIGKGGLYPPIDRTMLTVIAAGGCKRYVLRVDEKLTAFLEIEAAIRAASDWC